MANSKTPNGHHHQATLSTDVNKVQVSKGFLLTSTFISVLVAFAIGRTARMMFLVKPQLEFYESQQTDNQSVVIVESVADKSVMDLPNPVLKNGKIPPPTLYTSKNFDTARSATIHSRWVVTEQGEELAVSQQGEETCEASKEGGECASCSRGRENDAAQVDGTEEGDGEVHLPVGQHLLMDIKQVDAAFLASEERLAKAMLEVVGECGLTLLSYHCHGLYPAGVSCVGVLLESHVSFHTWPAEGVITLDLFTCGPNSLLPIVDKVEQLFSVPRAGVSDLMDMPETIWAYKWRGFGDDSPESNAELTDLFTFPIGSMTEYKKEIASAKIGTDRIDVYDVLRSPYQTLESYKRVLKGGDSYEAKYPSEFVPDRIFFSNGVLQTRRSSEAVFHEMFVHPAMFAHKEPKNVAVLGFADGAYLREILKHKSVEKVFLLESDKSWLDFTLQHFPEYNDCSFLASAGFKSCLSDSRVTTFFGEFEDFVKKNVDVFDVVILAELELVDPSTESIKVLEQICGSMSDEAVLVANMGFTTDDYSPVLEVERMSGFIQSLVDVGFESVRDYEESHLGFSIPWRFALALKSASTKISWFGNDALFNIAIRKRIVRSSDGSFPLVAYDSSTQSAITYPTSLSEAAYCYDNDDDDECERKGFDSEIPNLPAASVMKVRQGEAELEVFVEGEIPSPSYIGLDELVHPVFFPRPTLNLLAQMESKIELSRASVNAFKAAYARTLDQSGLTDAFVPSSAHMFVKDVHQNAIETTTDGSSVYNPALERRHSVISATLYEKQFIGRGDSFS